MKSSLQTLSRIQKFKIDEQRKTLIELQKQEDKLVEDLRHLLQEYEREKEFAAHHTYNGDFGAYTKRYLAFHRYLELELDKVRGQITQVRDLISDMFKEQKTYEIIDDNRQQREAKLTEQKEQKMLDEIGTNNYIKQHH